ncbi:hypothetical protein BGZ65_009323, partial [Modicella reniformis]
NTRQHAKALRRLKNVSHVNDLETMIQPVQCKNPEESQLDHQFVQLKESFQDHAKSVFTVEKDLRDFYGSNHSKIARYQKEQGEKSR